MTPADIRRLHPEQYELLWRTILRREHGSSYVHVDAHGIDCLTDRTAYQVYHHQGAGVDVVRAKFRDDLRAAQGALASGRYDFKTWVFISTYSFKDPSQRDWFDEQRTNAGPLVVVTWGDEDLYDSLARHPDIAMLAGLGATPVTTQKTPASPSRAPLLNMSLNMAPKSMLTQHGIVWGRDGADRQTPYCAGCLASERWVPLSKTTLSPIFKEIGGFREYVCPLGHPKITLDKTQPEPMNTSEILALAKSLGLSPAAPAASPAQTQPPKPSTNEGESN